MAKSKNIPRNLFILIEGPDNVGKSTLISNIQNNFNQLTLHNLHYSSVKQKSTEVIVHSTKMYTEMFDIMRKLICFKDTGVICDRSHLGEMVYGPIYREYSGEYVLDIENKFSNNLSLWNNLFLVTCIDEPENLIKRDDGLSFTTDTDKKKVEVSKFISAHERSGIKNKLLLNISNFNAKEASNEVIKFIEDSYV